MIERRDVLKFVGGSALGALLTPAPWRLITDGALWSENWPGIPRPVRGEIRWKQTHCALCPAGCALRARCVVEQPVALMGAHGGLCPLGVTGHHLPYHPERVKDGPSTETAALVRAAVERGERVAVLDLRPGRTASWTHRRALGSSGLYLAPPQPAASYDLTDVKTVLSLGAPLLDGWGTPSSVFAARERFRLIQVEADESRTASLADVWLREAPPMDALRENGPAVVIDPSESAAWMEWNQQLGGWGKTVVARPEAPVPEAWRKTAAPVTDLMSVPEGSIRVLLIDEAGPGTYIPWGEIAPKLAPDAMVVAMTWWREGYARHARYVLPTAVFPEIADDVPAPVDSTTATFRVVSPLMKAPDSVVDPAAFVAAACGFPAGDALQERAAAILAMGRGTMNGTAIKGMSAEEFWKGLASGAAWVDSVRSTTAPASRSAMVRRPEAYATSPLMSKIYQESNLRLGTDHVAIGPDWGIEDGGRAMLVGEFGRRAVRVTVDAAIRPGEVQFAEQPAILDVCGRTTRPKVVRA